MKLSFYFFSLIAILATIRVITNKIPIHALLYFIVSLLSISCIFFSLGAYFIGALEVIIYAGAIMVLFVFIVMILNLSNVSKQEHIWLAPSIWLGPSLLSVILLIVLIFGTINIETHETSYQFIKDKYIGIALFGRYLLAVELASILLLAGLIVASHLGNDERKSYKR